MAERLADGELDAAGRAGRPPEVEDLGRGLNRLGDRIEHLLAAERELIADLSHRLRTPITALRLEVDALPDRALAAHLEERVDSLADSVDSVIRAARRPVRSAVPRCDASAVVADRVAFWAVLAEDQGRAVSITLPHGPCPVPVDADELGARGRRAHRERLRAHADGIAFSVLVAAREDGGARVAVGDAGVGIVGTGLDRARAQRLRLDRVSVSTSPGGAWRPSAGRSASARPTSGVRRSDSTSRPDHAGPGPEGRKRRPRTGCAAAEAVRPPPAGPGGAVSRRRALRRRRCRRHRRAGRRPGPRARWRRRHRRRRGGRRLVLGWRRRPRCRRRGGCRPSGSSAASSSPLPPALGGAVASPRRRCDVVHARGRAP